ncbi:hypothetical protein BD413DRAFT_71726 [Trametes elegans]|nr:hypothetical protein BD413DRAFT_71726 [Trametes elegans]
MSLRGRLRTDRAHRCINARTKRGIRRCCASGSRCPPERAVGLLLRPEPEGRVPTQTRKTSRPTPRTLHRTYWDSGGRAHSRAVIRTPCGAPAGPGNQPRMQSMAPAGVLTYYNTRISVRNDMYAVGCMMAAEGRRCPVKCPSVRDGSGAGGAGAWAPSAVGQCRARWEPAGRARAGARCKTWWAPWRPVIYTRCTSLGRCRDRARGAGGAGAGRCMMW